MTTVGTLVRDERKHCSSLVSIDGRTYPLKSASLSARAEGGIAATTLVQAYENPYQEALEVLYTLPLPADGAVIGYTMRLGNRVIRGEVRKREEARDQYRKALLEGHTAALLEQERDDTFSQKLGSLPPGESASIEIEILQPLAFLPASDGEPSCWEYRFPTVTGVRYQGAPGRVPDAEELDADRAEKGIPVTLEAALVIADGPVDRVRPFAPEQKIDVVANGSGAKAVIEAMPLNRDVVIRWTAGEQETGVRATEGKGLACDKGRYVLITLTPPEALTSAIPRDLTLLIDCSGSMSGEPLEQAKTVCAELLGSLNAGDRFEILAFSGSVRRLFPSPVDASEQKVEQALKELRKLSASGATEMQDAVMEALRPLRPGSQRQVILLTDGYIGFENEIVGEISRRMVPGARLHAVGVGTSVNRTLTSRAARAGRGREIIIGLKEDARKAAGRLLRATVRPVLTDISVEGTGLISFAPGKPRDVFAGQPALIFAEVKPEGGSLQISGTESSSRWTRVVEIPPLRAADGRSLAATPIPIGALFAREAIEDAENDLTASGDDAIRERIESLGLRHGISSSMTSLIAISEDMTVDPRDPRRRERLPVEVPAGVSAEGAGLMRAAPVGLLALSSDMEENLTLSEPRSSMRTWGAFATRMLHKLPAPPPPRPIAIERPRILKLEGQILVLEFEVPGNGFMLPDGSTDIEVEFAEGQRSRARVMVRESGKPGPQKAGLIVRLALRLQDHQCWHHASAWIRWSGSQGPVEVHVVF